MTDSVTSKIMAALTNEWLTAEQLHNRIDFCWAPVSIRTRLLELANDGLIDRRLGETTSGNGVRNEYRLLQTAEGDR